MQFSPAIRLSTQICIPSGWVRHGIVLVIFLVLQAIPSFSPQFLIQVFCTPSASLAALFLGTPLWNNGWGELIILHPALDVAVTEACSGYGFFCLTTALGLSLAIRHRRGRGLLLELLWLLPAIYGLALLTNTARIVCATHARVISAQVFPDSYSHVLHMGVGIAVFLTVLSCTWLTLKRRYESQS